MQRKRIYARVSLPSGTFVADWYDIDFRYFTKQLNGGLGECVLKLPKKLSYDGIDVSVGNDVQLFVADENSTDDTNQSDNMGVRRIYRGFISSVERWANSRGEGITVTLLGYYTLLSSDILKDVAQTTLYSNSTAGFTTASGSQDAADVGLMVRALIDQYRDETEDPKISYIDSDIPDTGNTVTYTFQQKTYRAALDKLKSLAPSGIYWYVNEDGLLSFDAAPTEPTHKFVFGKHFTGVSARSGVEKMRNVLLLWNGDTGSPIYKAYEDSASITKYGRRVEVQNDYGIASTAAADDIGAKFLAENAEPETTVTLLINTESHEGKHGYNIESIQPGDTCDIVGFDDNVGALADIFRGNMLITQVRYELHQVEVTVELVRSGLVDTQAQTRGTLAALESSDQSFPTTYS